MSKRLTKTIEIAVIDKVQPEFDAEKFSVLVLTEPEGRSAYERDIWPGCSWYHGELACKSCCITKFTSSDWIDSQLASGYHPRSDSILVARGSYKGVPGEFRLHKFGTILKAPYEH